MKTNTKQQLFDYIKKIGGAGPSKIASHLKISPQMVHRHLRALVAEGLVKKQGVPPKVIYQPVSQAIQYQFPALSEQDSQHLEKHYVTVTPSGEVLSGLQGFQSWALKTQQHKHFKALAHEYVKNHSALMSQHRNSEGLIDATFKIQETFDACFLDYLYYQEFYSIPKFGKTKTGQLIFLGKSGQDMHSIEELAALCKQSIENIIKICNIDCVVFTPHSIPRKISFLKEFQRMLAIPLPTATLLKVFSGKTPIAQKSLSKLADRIENASNTIFLQEAQLPFKRILLIDDAVGSGATLNQVAKKLKNSGVEFVCGFAVTGSLKGFEVVNEI